MSIKGGQQNMNIKASFVASKFSYFLCCTGRKLNYVDYGVLQKQSNVQHASL
jgi:hypothetical protein